MLDRLGVRLISVERPGLGSSTPSPERRLHDWATDIEHFAAAARVVTGVALVAGSDELAHPALRARIEPGVARLVELAVTEPLRAEAFFAGMSAQTLWDMVMGISGDGDRAVYDEPVFAAAYRRELSEGFSQGSAGYARDSVLALTPWPFDLSAIRVPVDRWYGALDTSPVHSPDLGETLARRLPTARRHVLEALLARVQASPR